MIGKTISHYKILEKLGEGGMGVVYKAEDTRLKRTVALKFLPPEWTGDPEAKKRFIHEAQAASALDHSNICTVHAIEEIKIEDSDRMFMVMACYEGETLKEKIQKGPLSLEEAVDIAAQIAEGLHEAHEKKIVHRDLKSANVMLTSKGQVKIMDFGLAKLRGRTKLTRTGTTLGTVAYMSPEQARGEEVDRRTDIWSLGVILFEMLTGKLPFKGDYEQAVMYSILNETQEPVTGLRSGVPIELERIVNKALSKDPRERYQHVEELKVDLCRWKKEACSERLPSRTGSMPSGSKTSNPRHRMAIAVIMALIFLIIPLYIFVLSPILQKGADILKLVVLPFENLGSEGDAYFADGITEEITTRLASVSRLGVISRNSAFYYADHAWTTRQIGQELDVHYIVSGTVRWDQSNGSPGRVRISPRLVRVSDDIQLWSQSYERVVTDIFGIQTDIAKKVVESLGITLLEQEVEHVETVPTSNLEAYQAFLQGRHMTRQPHFTFENWEQVIRSYQRAVRLDPDFALAHAELAKGHARLCYLRQDLSKARLKMADEAAGRALEINPNSPEVRLSLGYYHLWAHRNPRQALEEWTIAEKDLPNNPDLLAAKAAVFALQGDFEAAIEALESAFELSPHDAEFPTDIAFYSWLLHDYSLAMDASNRAIALAPDEMWPYLHKTGVMWSRNGATPESRSVLELIPFEQIWVTWAWIWQEIGERNFPEALKRIDSHPDDWISNKMWAMPKPMYKAFIYKFQNQSRKAREAYEAAREMLEAKVLEWPQDPRYHSSLGIAYAGLGRKEEALREGKKAVELLPISEDAPYGMTYEQELAIIYIMIEAHDLALERIEYLLNIPSLVSPGWLQVDIRFAPLYDHPRFKELMKQYTEKR